MGVHTPLNALPPDTADSTTPETTAIAVSSVGDVLDATEKEGFGHLNDIIGLDDRRVAVGAFSAKPPAALLHHLRS